MAVGARGIWRDAPAPSPATALSVRICKKFSLLLVHNLFNKLYLNISESSSQNSLNFLEIYYIFLNFSKNFKNNIKLLT